MSLAQILFGSSGLNLRLSRNFAGRNFGQVHRFEKATNSGLSDFKAIFTLQQKGQFVDAKPLLVPTVQSENVSLNQFILFSTSGFRGGKMLVVSAAIDVKYPAKRFYFVLKAQTLNSI